MSGSERWDKQWDVSLRSMRVQAMKSTRLLGDTYRDKNLQDQLQVVGRYIGELEQFIVGLAMASAF